MQQCQRCESNADLICADCTQMYCNDCDSQIHVKKYETHQRTHCNSAKSKALINLQEHCTQIKKNVTDYIQELHEALNVRQDKFMKQIEEYYQRELALIDQAMEMQRDTLVVSPNALLSSIECLILQVETRSPRRTPSQQQSARRSQSVKKLEVVEEFCNALDKRKFVYFQSHHNAIILKWNNCLQKVKYILEMGIGVRMQGVEQFKVIYQGPENQHIAVGLQSKTTYRFRLKVEDGEYSDVIQLQTLFNPSIEDSQIISRKFLSPQEIAITFERPGVVLATNQVHFGIQSWDVKLIITGLVEDMSASLIIGVANKQRKLIGTTFNYGYQRESLQIKATLNMNEKTLLIQWKNTSETHKIPSAVYPAFQNKNGHKGSGCKLQIQFL